MGFISLSFLFGDAAARALIGRLIHLGLGWRGLFIVSAGVLAWLELRYQPHWTPCARQVAG